MEESITIIPFEQPYHAGEHSFGMRIDIFHGGEMQLIVGDFYAVPGGSTQYTEKTRPLPRGFLKKQSLGELCGKLEKMTGLNICTKYIPDRKKLEKLFGIK